ncbi:MAG: hypothetical protein PHR35_08620 [Kiritimatiellae bacterium]|nr:hypothetical protein [Kiritimatiellia bacterium]
MFNRTVNIDCDIPKALEIHHHRAPTEESIRLWEEMREKAYKAILNTIDIHDNSFNIVAVSFGNDPLLGFDNVLKFKFMLNGKIVSDCLSVNRFEAKDRAETVRLILRKVAEYIAREIMACMLKSGDLGGGEG